ncbi:MAG: hypothetical protein HY998_04165 [candidate division NC10 bacterium]|nr:hypothetical protein [candidate division NC10 bacterium]
MKKVIAELSLSGEQQRLVPSGARELLTLKRTKKSLIKTIGDYNPDEIFINGDAYGWQFKPLYPALC